MSDNVCLKPPSCFASHLIFSKRIFGDSNFCSMSEIHIYIRENHTTLVIWDRHLPVLCYSEKGDYHKITLIWNFPELFVYQSTLKLLLSLNFHRNILISLMRRHKLLQLHFAIGNSIVGLSKTSWVQVLILYTCDLREFTRSI